MKSTLFRQKGKLPKPTGATPRREPSFSDLPPVIARKLRAADRRIVTVLFWRGFFTTLCAALIAMSAIMAIDAMVVIFSPAVRWLLTLSGAAAVLLTAALSLIRPLCVKRTPSRLARLLERRHPEMEERLSTVVELLADPDGVAEGSRELLEVVTQAAVLDAGAVSPRREFTMETVRPKLLIAASILALLGVLYLCWPDSVGRLVLRAVAPHMEVDNLYADSLQVAPGDAVVLQGQPFEVELAVLGGFPGQTYIHMQTEGRSGESSERMRQISDEEEGRTSVRNFRHGIGSVDHSFRYRISCGSALTRAYTVTCVPEPAYTNLSVSLTYPEYTRLGTKELPPETGDISALPGTTASISMLPNRTMAEAVLVTDKRERAPDTVAPDGTLTWNLALTAESAGTWSFRLVDSHSFTNKPAYYAIELVPDLEPVVKLTEPEKREYKLRPYAAIPFTWTATDDFGIEQPTLQVRVSGEGWRDLRPVAEWTEVRPGQWVGSDTFRLSEVTMGFNRSVRFRVSALDRCPEEAEGPHRGTSEAVLIHLDETALSYLTQQALEEQKAVNSSLDGAAMELQRALDRANEARQAAQQRHDQPSLDRVADSMKHIGRAEKIVRDMLQSMSGTPLESLSDEARALLRDKIAPASDAADAVVFSDPRSFFSKSVIIMIEMCSIFCSCCFHAITI